MALARKRADPEAEADDAGAVPRREWSNTYQSLTSLDGLEALTFAGGGIGIQLNPALPDISGIRNVDAASLEGLGIEGNTALSDCAVASVCVYLADNDAQVRIQRNANGCASVEEVVAACLVPVRDLHAATPLRVQPNPTRGRVALAGLDPAAELTDVRVFDAQGRATAIVADPDGTFDFAAAAPGLYRIVVRTADGRALVGAVLRE